MDTSCSGRTEPLRFGRDRALGEQDCRCHFAGRTKWNPSASVGQANTIGWMPPFRLDGQPSSFSFFTSLVISKVTCSFWLILKGTLTQNASPFLFPCAIEYSLICAAIMYEIWKHTGEVDHHHWSARSRSDSPAGARTPRTPGGNFYPYSQRRSPHHYSVDCTNANNGLFFGIFVLVLSILSMILFFVLIHRDDYKSTAITIVHLTELILYIMTLIAVLIGIIQVCSVSWKRIAIVTWFVW